MERKALTDISLLIAGVTRVAKIGKRICSGKNEEKNRLDKIDLTGKKLFSIHPRASYN